MTELRMDSFSYNDIAWFWLAAGLSLAGFLLGVISLVRHRRHSRFAMFAVLATAFAAQTYALSLRGRTAHGCPLNNPFEIVQFISWSLTLLYLVVGPPFRLSLLGFFTAALSTVLSCTALLIPAWDSTKGANPFGPNPWIEFHAALATFSYGVFGLLALTALMQLLQNYSLKHKQLHGLFSFLPSIVDLEQINVRLLLTGVALLSASLVVGSVWWLRNPGLVNASKLAVTCAVWAAYLITLTLRLRGRLQAQRLAWTCITLFAAAMISLGPVNASRHPVGQTAELNRR